MIEIKRAKIELDAMDQSVGRVATKAASFLSGKNKPDYERYIDNGDFVTIINAGKVKFTGKKLVQKDYYKHTMHPGGLKKTSMKKVFDADPREVMKKAIYGMLPKNNMREEMMKRLTIKA
ncbi:MAG: 50S ribosomal protein L13 [Patescibacteria group bacterium]